MKKVENKIKDENKKTSKANIKSTKIKENVDNKVNDEDVKKKFDITAKMTNHDKMLWQNFINSCIPIVCCIALLLVSFGMKKLILKSSVDTITAQAKELKKLSETKDVEMNAIFSENNKSDNKTDILKSVYTGAVDENDALIDNFFSTYCQWSSGAEQEQLRLNLQAYLPPKPDNSPVYDDSNSFVACFLTPQDIVYTEDGHKVYEADNESLSMQYNGMNLYRLYTDADAITYGALISVTSLTAEGQQNHVVYVTFVVKNGLLYQLEASPLYNF